VNRVPMVAATVLLAGALGSPLRAALKSEYRMQVTVGPTTYWGMGATRFADLVRERTQGRIVVKPYFGSQLLKGAQLNSSQMVARGGIDLAFESTINTADPRDERLLTAVLRQHVRTRRQAGKRLDREVALRPHAP